jgi:hypothetical protein
LHPATLGCFRSLESKARHGAASRTAFPGIGRRQGNAAGELKSDFRSGTTGTGRPGPPRCSGASGGTKAGGASKFIRDRNTPRPCPCCLAEFSEVAQRLSRFNCLMKAANSWAMECWASKDCGARPQLRSSNLVAAVTLADRGAAASCIMAASVATALDVCSRASAAIFKCRFGPPRGFPDWPR